MQSVPLACQVYVLPPSAGCTLRAAPRVRRRAQRPVLPACLNAWRIRGLGSNGTVNRLKRSEVSPSRFAEFERELKRDIWLGVNVPTYFLGGTAWDASEVTGKPNA